MSYDPKEQDEILDIFLEMLKRPTADGGRKRECNEKPSWKVDTSHKRAIYSHLGKWANGDGPDEDSGGVHPLIAMAWRALAQAAREEHAGDPGWS